MAFHQYNTFLGNVSQYNADAFFLVVALAESIASADVLGPNNDTKVLVDSITPADATVVKTQSRPFSETILSTDTLTKSILNKGLAESVRVNDWCQVERKKENSPWSS